MTSKQKFPRLVGRYCSYLLPTQTLSTFNLMSTEWNQGAVSPCMASAVFVSLMIIYCLPIYNPSKLWETGRKGGRLDEDCRGAAPRRPQGGPGHRLQRGGGLVPRERPKPKCLLSAETEYSAETQLFCNRQNSRIQNSTYLVQICHYSVSAEYSVRYSAECFGRNRFRSDSTAGPTALTLTTSSTCPP